MSGKPIPLYNAGKDSDDFYYVENYCKAVTLALKTPKAVGGVFNVGTGGNVAVRDLAQMVKKLTGSGSKLEILPPRTELERRPRSTRPSIQKIRRILGYEPVVPLKEGLERTIRWYVEKSTS
jgi:nucleoside-diphosphate-sugar epimerase